MPPRARNVAMQKARLVRRKIRKQGFTKSFNTNFDRITYPYKQYCDQALLSFPGCSSRTLDTGYAWQFALNQIPQVVTFAALYDSYRINLIEFTIRPRAIRTQVMSASEGLVSQQFVNNIIVAVDHDDANPPLTYNELREYGNAKEYSLTDGLPRKIIFKPAVAALLYNNGITQGNTERFSPWIDVANTNIPHYGIKLVVPPTNTVNDFTFDVTVRMLIEFRQVR